MNIITQLWNYCKLGYKLLSLHTEYFYHNTIDTGECHRLIDLIHKNLIECGAICIKFCQWITPILDTLYNERDKIPCWLKTLEIF